MELVKLRNLLKKFKSINNIKKATDEELIELIGKDKTRRIREFLEHES
jgi:excinuclease ABC subunit C